MATRRTPYDHCVFVLPGAELIDGVVLINVYVLLQGGGKAHQKLMAQLHQRFSSAGPSRL